MRTKIVLQRSVVVEEWIVQASFGFLEKRLELMPILKQILLTGSTTVEDVASQLLFEPIARRRVAERWLQISRQFGLSNKNEDGKYFLTSLGLESAKTGQIFVPHEGLWKIWVCKDPLIRFPILLVEEFKEEKRQDGKEMISSQDYPKYLEKSFDNAECCKTLLKEEYLQCISINEKAIKVKDHKFSIHWNLGEKWVSLSGEIDGKRCSGKDNGPEIEENDIWLNVLNEYSITDKQINLLSLWNAEIQAMKKPLESVSESSRNSMEGELKFQNYKHDIYGSFEPFTVSKIPLLAMNQDEAALWANWHLKNSFFSFATTAVYSTLVKSAAAPFEKFYDLTLPTRSELIESIKSESKQVPWQLMAAEDWDL